MTIDDLQRVAGLSSASVSADGQLLAYVKTAIGSEDMHRDLIVVVSLSTGTEVKSWEGSAPQWSPSGSEIAYLAGFGGEEYIWVRTLDTDEERPLAPIFESHYFMCPMK